MQNRALILSRHSKDIDSLAAALCSMVSDKTLRLPESLYNVPLKFTQTDFRVHIFPVLASLASYHAHLEPSIQQRLIKCLEVRFSLLSEKWIIQFLIDNNYCWSLLSTGWTNDKMCESMRHRLDNVHFGNARRHEQTLHWGLVKFIKNISYRSHSHSYFRVSLK